MLPLCFKKVKAAAELQEAGTQVHLTISSSFTVRLHALLIT